MQHAVEFVEHRYMTPRMTTSRVPRELQIPSFWGQPHDESDEECKPNVSLCLHIWNKDASAFGVKLLSHMEQVLKAGCFVVACLC